MPVVLFDSCSSNFLWGRAESIMPSYADERREAVVAKLLPPRNLSVSEVARQEGISVATIYIYGVPLVCK